MYIRLKNAFLGAAALLGLSLAAPTIAAGAERPQAYSAIAIHGFPGRAETSGRIVKSGSRIRLEYTRDGQKVVQIILPAQGVMYLLNPRDKTYMEFRGPSVPTTSTEGYSSPCPPTGSARKITCRKIGSEVISGITAEKWVLAGGQQGRALTILWDPARKRALRQDFPGGGNMVMGFVAMEEIAGRKVEHWLIRLAMPGQKVQGGDWWFDPELRVTLRENLPSGETRRLENIKVGPVDEAAFQVPSGWTLVKAPAGAAPARK